MYKIVAALLELLGLIIKAEQKKERKEQQEKHQDKVDDAREDPASAFNEHFNSNKKGDQ
ncbi:hypothetical protein [Vibrio phage vB_VpaM_XM1]